MTTPEITVCVPVFNAAPFLAETLDRIAAQTFSDIRVLISVDQSEDDSEAICRRYLSDRRFELIVQRERLNWVRNANALIERVDTAYFCIVPHDDLLDSRYLAEVHRVAASDPAIACVYSDIQGFGTRWVRLIQRDIRGDKLARVLDFLLHHFKAVPFRGLVRRHSRNDRPYLPTHLRDDFAADTVWCFQLALRGELRRVPASLYLKRYHHASVHHGWAGWSRNEMAILWAEQAAACARIALEHFEDADERELVLAGALTRMSSLRGTGSVTPHEPHELVAASAAFCDLLGDVLKPADVRRLLAAPNLERLRGVSRQAARRPPPSFPRRIVSRLVRLWRGATQRL